MKRFNIIFLFAYLLLIFVIGCGQPEIHQEKQYKIHYYVTEGGYIEGEADQTVSANSFSKLVKAIPYDGYAFISWDDGRSYYTRADMTNCDLSVTALFKKIEFKVDYSANVGGQIIGETSQTVKYGETSRTVKAVPSKGYEFIGWSDGVQTADRNDVSVRRDIEVRANFAKHDTVRFPILMVFVTEFHADLELKDGSVFDADYIMSESERMICKEVIPNKVVGFLNDVFAGEVVFETDIYFTTDPLGIENTFCGTDAWLNYDYGIEIKSVDEVKDLIDKYRCVITTYGMNDIWSVAQGGGGYAVKKEAYINADLIWGPLYINNLTPEFLLDFGDISVNLWWDAILAGYLHEFTHSVEMYYMYTEGIISLDLHGVIAYYAKLNNKANDLEPFVHYLLRDRKSVV